MWCTIAIQTVIPSVCRSSEAIFAWTNPAVFQDWLKMPANHLKVFVAYRVAKITSRVNVDHWRYVSTHLNPADLISRGFKLAALTENFLWWSGPRWLALSPAHWLRRPDINRKQELLDFKSAVFIACPQPEEFGVRFSSFARLCRSLPGYSDSSSKSGKRLTSLT